MTAHATHPGLARTIRTLFVSGLLFFLASQPVAAELSAAISGPSRGTVYQYQTFRITLTIRSSGVRLDNRIRYSNLFEETDLEQLTPFKEQAPERRMKQSKLVETRRFLCDARFRKPGTTKIAPILHVATLKRARSFFGRTWKQNPTDLTPVPITLRVLPLPEAGRPAGFSGAVGHFTMAVDVTPTSLTVGDIVTVNTTISGKGYRDHLKPPQVTVNRHFKVYDTKKLERADGKNDMFEQKFVPQNPNASEISQISFSYFDPIRRRYTTLRKGPLRLSFHAQKRIQEESFKRSHQTNALPHHPHQRPDKKALPSRVRTLWKHLLHGTWGREEAILSKPIQGRLAPSVSALPTLDLRQGSSVFVLQKHQGWIKISFDGNQAWIPENALAKE